MALTAWQSSEIGRRERWVRLQLAWHLHLLRWTQLSEAARRGAQLFAISKVWVPAGGATTALVNSSNLLGACAFCTVDVGGMAAVIPKPTPLLSSSRPSQFADRPTDRLNGGKCPSRDRRTKKVRPGTYTIGVGDGEDWSVAPAITVARGVS